LISGNDFTLLSVALNLETSKSLGLCYFGNNFNAVTTPLSGSATFGDGATSQINPNNPNIGNAGGLAPYFSTAAAGWEFSHNGVIEAWGTSVVTAGTPLAVVYATAIANFPGFTTVLNFSVTSVAPAAGVTGVFVATVPTNTQMTLNANGTGNVIVHWRIKGV
ncbi:MAG: hypothetical protein ACRETD_09415, partial [Steroidobacteraceae bacterium]